MARFSFFLFPSSSSFLSLYLSLFFSLSFSLHLFSQWLEARKSCDFRHFSNNHVILFFSTVKEEREKERKGREGKREKKELLPTPGSEKRKLFQERFFLWKDFWERKKKIVLVASSSSLSSTIFLPLWQMKKIFLLLPHTTFFLLSITGKEIVIIFLTRSPFFSLSFPSLCLSFFSESIFYNFFQAVSFSKKRKKTKKT